LTPLNEEALRLQEAGIISRTAEIDNEAIAHRFNAAKTDAEKERFLKKMLNREITVFTNMIGEDLQNLTKNDDIRGLHGVLQKAGVNPRSVEWQQFQRALSIAEKRLMKDDAYKWSAFNLGDRAQFDGLMPDALKAVGLAGTPGELDKMFKVITGVQDFMHAKGENGQSRIKNWVAHKPFANNIILSHGDFDWHKVDFNKLGAFSLERRINDFLGQAAAGTKFDELMTTSELLMPAPGKEVDTIMKIKELRNAIVSYSGMDDAEKMASAMMEVVIDMNKNRVIQGNPIFNVGWVPGAVSVMRRAVGIHESADQTINAVKNGAAWIIERFPGGKKVVHDHHLRPSHNHPHPKWPRSMAEAVSLAVGFQGFEGNAWDEYKIASFITGAETATLFADRPAYIEEMMSKYKASGFFRAFVGLPRKYWWVVFAATVAVATTSSVQEEAGSGGKSHH